MNVSEDLKTLVKDQKYLNRQVLENLKPLGVSEKDERKLDYFFISPDKKTARLLAQHIKANSDYRVYPPHFNGRDWAVTGTTSRISLVTTILDIWVEKMCALGLKYQCKFDGWGTLVL